MAVRAILAALDNGGRMYILHYTPDAASLVVRIVLTELGQPFDTVLLDRDKGQHDSAAYRALQPLGLVPALETSDGPMFETAAILLWLADRHQAMAPAAADADRGDFLKWMFFVNNSVHPTLLQLFYPHRVAGDSCVTQVTAHARDRLAEYLGLLDRTVAQAPRWSDAAQPTVLGHYIGQLLRWMQFGGPGTATRFPIADYPALRAMAEALEQRPAVQAAARAETLGPAVYTDPDRVG